jgi:hypothetical protein
MIFYALSGLVALFCAVALGLGPLVFALAGALAAVVGFRARRPRWWGLPVAVAGTAEAAGALTGLATKSVAELTAVLFAVMVAVRLAGHRPGMTAGRPGQPDARMRRSSTAGTR